MYKDIGRRSEARTTPQRAVVVSSPIAFSLYQSCILVRGPVKKVESRVSASSEDYYKLIPISGQGRTGKHSGGILTQRVFFFFL